MNEQLNAIYQKIDNYLLLPDKDVVKLLCAFAIGCKLPTEPPWLFLASGSSTGKTQLISLLEGLGGYFAVDDMTNNALLSGMKRHDQSASLLHRAPQHGGFLVFSDFTTMLAKRKEDLSAILAQLRVVFDGKATRATGGLESEITWQGKLGLLAGSTTALYAKTEEYAEVGQRMVIYHMPQPDDYEVGNFKFENAKTDRKALRLELQDMIRDYVENLPVPLLFEQLPEFDPETKADILDIGHLAVSARSPITRNQYSREREIEDIGDKEGIGRIQGQLMTLAYGLMLQNPDGKLNDVDRKILYKIGLDCISTKKRLVLQALTEFGYGGDIDQVALAIHHPKNVTEQAVEDLVGLKMIEKQRQYFGNGSKYTYRLKDKFKDIMMRFEGITVREEELPVDEAAALDPFNI